MSVYIFAFIIGTIFASFIHVYVTRTLRGESIIKPGSHCTNCNHRLKWYELIPIVSFLIQRGRCRNCSTKIGTDSFLVELVTGISFALVYFVYGISYETSIGFVIVLVMISIFISDFKEMVILDSTLVVGTVFYYVLIFLELGMRKGVYKSFLYGIFGFVLLFVIKILGDAVFKRESLGGGDIKFAFFMGSVLPYNLFLIALVIGSFAALPYALYISISKKTNELAFGPFLAIGLFVAFLLKSPILNFLELLVS